MVDNRLIPAGIRDSNTITLNELINRLGTTDITPVLVYIIDNVPAGALNHLAEQFHITGFEGWMFAKTDYEKRTLLKNSINTHRIKGTKGAIKQALEALGFSVNILASKEYSGRPDRFKVTLSSVSQDYSAESSDKIINVINEYKNVRSVLEELIIELFLASNHPIIGGVISDGEIITIQPYADVTKLLLDILNSNPVIACSLRNLSNNYNQPVLTAYSDGDYQDIYAEDYESSMLTLANGGDVFLRILWDQSGNGNHIGQSDTTKMPILVENGTLVTLDNGEPAWKMHHSAAGLTKSNGFIAPSWDDQDIFDLFMSYQCDSAIANGILWGEYNTSNGNILYNIENVSSQSKYLCRGWNGWYLFLHENKDNIFVQNKTTVIDGQSVSAKGLLLQQEIKLNKGQNKIYLNDTEIVNQDITTNTNSNTAATNLYNNRYYTNAPVGLKANEILLFKNISSVERGLIKANCLEYIN